jgi:hypothetical protein
MKVGATDPRKGAPISPWLPGWVWTISLGMLLPGDGACVPRWQLFLSESWYEADEVRQTRCWSYEGLQYSVLWFPRLCNYNGDRSLPQRGLTLKQCFRRGVCSPGYEVFDFDFSTI